MTPLTDLSTLTADDFISRRGRPVRVIAGDEAMPLEIADINAMGQSERPGGAFSVLFRGPKSPVIDQAMHQVEFDTEPPIGLFLVPVGEDDSGILYEAVFG